MYLCITLQEADENAIFVKWILDSDTKKIVSHRDNLQA